MPWFPETLEVRNLQSSAVRNLEGSYYDAATGTFHDFVLQREGATRTNNGWQHPPRRNRHIRLLEAAHELRRRYVMPLSQPVYPFLASQLQPLAAFLERQATTASLGNVLLIWPDFEQQYQEHVTWFVTILPANEHWPSKQSREEVCGLLPDTSTVELSKVQTQGAMLAAGAVIAAWNRERSVSY